jgi:hypothetical protein
LSTFTAILAGSQGDVSNRLGQERALMYEPHGKAAEVQVWQRQSWTFKVLENNPNKALLATRSAAER